MTEQPPYPRSRKRDLLMFFAAVALPLPWIVIQSYEGIALSLSAIATLSGVAILGPGGRGVLSA